MAFVNLLFFSLIQVASYLRNLEAIKQLYLTLLFRYAKHWHYVSFSSILVLQDHGKRSFLLASLLKCLGSDNYWFMFILVHASCVVYCMLWVGKSSRILHSTKVKNFLNLQFVFMLFCCNFSGLKTCVHIFFLLWC